MYTTLSLGTPAWPLCHPQMKPSHTDKAKVLHQCVPTTHTRRGGVGWGPGQGTCIHWFTSSRDYYGRVSGTASVPRSGGLDPPIAVSPAAGVTPLLLLLLTVVTSAGYDNCCS